MSIYEFNGGNRTGFDGLISDVAVAVPIFTPMLLAFVFFMVVIIGYRKQSISTGSGDAPLWATIGGIVTSSFALLLTLGENIIDLPTLVITFVITIVMAIWLFSSKDRL